MKIALRVGAIDPAPTALRAFLAAYLVLLGASLLLLPTPSLVGPQVDEWVRGVLTAASGVALLWLGVRSGGHGRGWRVVHVLVALPQGAIGLLLISNGSLSAGITLLTFALAIGSLPDPGRISIAPGGSRGDALTLMLLLVTAVQGALIAMGADPSTAVPASVGVDPTAWGLLVLFANAGAIAALLTEAPRPLRIGLVLLAAILVCVQLFVASIMFSLAFLVVGGATYLRVLALATYPWRSRMHLDWRSLEMLAAVSLITAALAPVLALATADRLLGTTDDLVARQLQFGVVSVLVLGVFVLSVIGGRRLARPIDLLAARVARIQEPEVADDEKLPLTELTALSTAIDRTAQALRQERHENERLLDELRSATAAKDEFLSLVSHELRTPVTTILASLSLLEREELASTTHDLVEGARGDTERLVGIIDNLLILARLESGTRPDVEPVMVRRLVEGSLSAARRQHPERRYSLVGDARPIIEANAEHVKMVVDNFLSNAAKYSPPATDVSVEIQADEIEAVVSVIDAGPGIDAADAEHVFDPFYRSERTRDAAAGLGIGLTVCRRVMEANGGRCWVEPRKDRTGSVFRLALPLAPIDTDDPSVMPAEDVG